ncbi:MAG: hypothetical protein M0R80_23175 [Proteobacteria bacterium]|jgi:hypothetical protein|nr:hypothetical protein [Pseudomonadota bacterium]
MCDLRIAIFALLAACACREDPAAREVAAPERTPETAIVISAKPDAEPEAEPDASPGDASAPDASVARGGTLCVAPLDYSETPGKGGMSVDMFGDGPSPTPRNARAIVTVNGEKREITLKKGARFDGLPLDEPVLVSLASPGRPPYFGRKISFAKEGAEALCLYENAFYGTVQVSDVPRRPFCRKCMRDDAP